VSEDIWVYKILHPFLDLKALATAGRCNTFFQEFWQYVLKQNVIRVPEGCPTMNQALDLAVVFSERNECTRENPVKVEVGEGEHAMFGFDMGGNTTHHIPVGCNNITIVGKGKGKTTFLGGFEVKGKQNVKIQHLSLRNVAGHGLYCRGGGGGRGGKEDEEDEDDEEDEEEREEEEEEEDDDKYEEEGGGVRGGGDNVDVTECCFKKCRDGGMHVCDGATVTATRCDFMQNSQEGVSCGGAYTNVTLSDCKMHDNEWGLAVDTWATVTATRCDVMINDEEGVYCGGADTDAGLIDCTINSTTLIDCTIHHNGGDGLFAYDHAVVNLRGTKMDIHSNKKDGIVAIDNAKVSIHLPSQHNTTHGNAWQNRFQDSGGSIASINADGTFTHAEEEAHDDDE